MRRLYWLISLVAVGIVAPAWSQQDQHFGVVGITAGQTAQLNVVNTIPDSGERPCLVSLEFFDTDGHAVGTPEEKSLAPGQAGSASVAQIRPERLELRALVRKVDTPQTESDECRGIHATLEVLETRTGKTAVFIGGVASVQASTPDDCGGQFTPDDFTPFIGRLGNIDAPDNGNLFSPQVFLHEVVDCTLTVAGVLLREGEPVGLVVRTLDIVEIENFNF